MHDAQVGLADLCCRRSIVAAHGTAFSPMVEVDAVADADRSPDFPMSKAQYQKVLLVTVDQLTGYLELPLRLEDK